MNILFITSRLPYPLYKGDKLRTYYQIKHLSRHHDVYLLSFIESEEEYQHIDGLKAYCKDIHVILLKPLRSYFNVIRHLFSPLPAQTAYYLSRDMVKQTNDIIRSRRIDLVHVQLIRMAPYGAGQKIPKVIDLVDSLSLGLKRRIKSELTWKLPFYYLEYIKVKTYEKKVLSWYDRALIVSDVDKASLENGGSIDVVSNGVNLEGSGINNSEPKKGPPRKLIFTGNLAYYPNVDTARYICYSIWPRLKERYEDLHLYIVGKNPSRAVRRLQTSDITVTGYVEDIQAALREADIYIAPFRMGSGVQNKILEAFAAKLPVVTTVIGNEGIHAENGESIIVENTLKGQVNAIVALIENPAHYQAIAMGGREFVGQDFKWMEIIEHLEEIYVSVVHTRRLKTELQQGMAS